MPTITLPVFHQRQSEIFNQRGRLNAVRCGRRWGKTKQMVALGANAAARRQKVGLFTPEHKQLDEPYGELLHILTPIRQSANKNEGTIRTTTGGQLDFWTLNDNELAGRGREYDLILIDEAAFTKPSQMTGIWERSIKPTMLTRLGSRAWVFSTPNGNDPENFFWRLCNDPKYEFKEHYAPTSTSPYVPPEELERERQRNHPLVFRQEFMAEFVDFSGEAFFSLDKLLDNGAPVAYPPWCDTVFAIIDSAVKSGREHDGTAVSYWSYSSRGGHPLICLDYDIVSIDGALLETWIPGVFARCDELARECNARHGSAGAWIEDAQSGSILLQQCALKGLPAQALPAELTAAGKDDRAINASGPVYRGEVKFSAHAFNKNDVTFKGATRNHLVSQVTGYRVGDRKAATRADDLFDTFVYAVAITLGNVEGIAA
jgi:hypothetical protein